MSPLGEIFRTRLRKFPSLVNCCTIDWFTEWPEEALLNVAKGSIADSDLILGKDEDSCVEMFKCMH
jgi:dynein heavy chain